MRKVLCLSTSNYYPFPTRKQNIMNRLTDCDVVYINPAVTYIAPLKDRNIKLNTYKEAPVQAMDHLWVYNQPPVMPFYNKKRSVNVINQKRLAKYLAPILNHHGFGQDFYIWCYSPTVCDLIAPLAKEIGMEPATLWGRVIYDCVDRHSAYPGMIDPKLVDDMEEDLATAAGTVFATAQGLYDRLKAFNENAYLIPNGCNFELFNKVVNLEGSKKENPTFGFVGMLQECTDYGCLEELAKAYPKSEIKLVGRKLPGVDLSSIEKYSNIEFVGLLPQEELPDRIKDFDVCLNIFRNDDLSRDVSPLKFYEYLATGKPVVSTPVPLQVRDYDSCIYIAENKEEFVDKCKEALAEAIDSPKRAERLKEAEKCSWDERVKTMRNILSW